MRRECRAYGYEDIGGERTLGLGCVRFRRDPGGAPGTQPLLGSRTRMVDDATALVLWGVQRLSRSERLIYRSA
jgi:hypothetical protein